MAGTRYVTAATLAHQTASWLAAIRPWSRGRGLPSLDRAALLVVDVQQYFRDPASHAYLPALEVVLPNIVALGRCFQSQGRPVVFTQYGSLPGAETMMGRWWKDDLRQGEDRARLVDELSQQEPDMLLSKCHYSAFCHTDLRGWLQEQGCDAVVICGVMTHLCCESTAREAFMVGLAPVLVADACASQDEDLHLGALRNLAHGFAVVESTGSVLEQLVGETQPGRARNQPGRGGKGGGEDQPGRGADIPEDVELCIVGAGPAGLAAAIQARRAGLSVLVLDPDGYGGAACTAERIENYPGFPGGISGRALMERFLTQVRQWSPLLGTQKVLAVNQQGRGFSLALDNGRSITARAVILATGAVPRTLDLGLAEDLPVVYRGDALPKNLQGKHILVVGGGEAALDQALLVRRRGAEQVLVAVRGEQPRAMDILLKRAAEQDIELLLETEVEINPGEGLKINPGEGLKATVSLRRRGETFQKEVDAVVVCVGKEPRLPPLPAGVSIDGEAPAVDALGRTAVPGLYVVGDARRGPYRQVAIAVGDGVAAAMNVVCYLADGKGGAEQPCDRSC